MIDRYTKLVLTIIAGALVVLVAQNLTTGAVAQAAGCGLSPKTACWVTASIPFYVATPPLEPLEVKIR